MNTEIPHWAKELNDDTALPYYFWKVMDKVDGKRTVSEIAEILGISEEKTIQLIGEANAQAQMLSKMNSIATDEVKHKILSILSKVLDSEVVASIILESAEEDQIKTGALLDAIVQDDEFKQNPSKRANFAALVRKEGII